MEQLISRFTPILYFHSSEKYFPSSIDFILNGSELIDNQNVVIPKKELNSKSLYDYSNSKYPGTTGLTSLYINFVDDLIGGETDIDSVPVYATVNESANSIRISYSFIFPYNGPKMVMGCIPSGQHFGDVEHITVEVNRTSNDLVRVYFGAHTGTEGRWVDAKDVLFEEERIVVFSALHSHACYPQSGTAIRFGGFGNDLMNRGRKWEPYAIRLYPQNDPNFKSERDGWMYFAGRIGFDGVTSISDKDYFNQGDSETNNPPIINSYVSAC